MNPVGGGGGASVQQVIAMRDAMLEKSRLLKELQQGQQAQSAVPTTDAPAQGGGFGDTLQDALSSVNDAQQRSSAISEAYARGETQDVAKVMLARQEAGVAFEATLQVRNKLLSAYQEIMRMGV